MQKQKTSTAKTLAWVYGAVAAFTATYLIGGILLERQADKKKRESEQH